MFTLEKTTGYTQDQLDKINEELKHRLSAYDIDTYDIDTYDIDTYDIDTYDIDSEYQIYKKVEKNIFNESFRMV
jgi:hypothetical protein